MPRSKKRKKRKIGPYKAEEIESVQIKPKKKKIKKLLAPEPWLDQQEYFQDKFDKKGKDKRMDAEKKREPWIWKESYYQDQYGRDYDDDDEELDEKKGPKRQKRSRHKKKSN
ncbi:MAG: hypothetical protein ACFFD2_24070 [Promethearchaeota archaeon]